MKFELTKQIGNMSVTFSDEVADMKGFFQKAGVFCDLPSRCGHCSGTELGVQHRNVKTFDYYEIVCEDNGCGWRLKYGVRKDTNDLFPKEWGPPHQANAAPSGTTPEGW